MMKSPRPCCRENDAPGMWIRAKLLNFLLVKSACIYAKQKGMKWGICVICNAHYDLDVCWCLLMFWNYRWSIDGCLSEKHVELSHAAGRESLKVVWELQRTHKIRVREKIHSPWSRIVKRLQIAGVLSCNGGSHFRSALSRDCAAGTTLNRPLSHTSAGTWSAGRRGGYCASWRWFSLARDVVWSVECVWYFLSDVFGFVCTI